MKQFRCPVEEHTKGQNIFTCDLLLHSASACSLRRPIPPKTVKQKLARKNELKAKSTLLLAILDEHLLKFHGIKDAKTLWEAIKARFGACAKREDSRESEEWAEWEGLGRGGLYSIDWGLETHQPLEIHGESYISEDANLKVVEKSNHQLGTILPLIMIGYFARECRAPRNLGNRNRDGPRGNAPVDTSTTNALVVQDGIGSRPDWLFDIDLLTNSINYEPVTVMNQTNKIAGIKDNTQQYILLPLLYDIPKAQRMAVADCLKKGYTNTTNKDSIVSPSANTVRIGVDLPKGKHAIGNIIGSRAHKNDKRGDSRVNKARLVEKALYGLHQAPRAWYETLSTYLIENGFRRGTIDKTLFIKKDKGDILLVQVYVDDIIFGSTKKSLCDEFEGLMHKRFQMSSMGELTFFLGLQVQQKEDGIFISQDKYVAEILKKFDFATVKTASTPIETNKALVKDEEAEAVDVHLYRSMIGSLMYLTASRPDIMFVVCACARDSPFDLEAFSDTDYARASLDMKSTIGGCQFLGKRCYGFKIKCLIIDETIYKKWEDRMERAATAASSLDAE
ncbi:putative ribonuclease H-like domain-containing protein [Tanacetum coccineum]